MRWRGLHNRGKTVPVTTRVSVSSPAQHEVVMRLVVTDLDGTLLDCTGGLSPRNRDTLTGLGELGVVRVVATGRSYYSVRSVLDPDFPVDYVAFSTGAGLVRWSDQQLLVAYVMPPPEVQIAVAALKRRRLDFMLHQPVPDNHRFMAWGTGRPNPDFEHRRQRYRAFESPWVEPLSVAASQLLAVEPSQSLSQYDELVVELDRLKVIRATSPIDHESRWLEIFPATVSKARATRWLCEHHQIPETEVVAVGNDYNDLDMLAWAPRSFVVANAPMGLRESYAVVGSNDEDGFSDAVSQVLAVNSLGATPVGKVG